MRKFLIISSSWINERDQLELKEKLGNDNLFTIKDKKVNAEKVIEMMTKNKEFYVIFTKNISASFINSFMSKARNKKVYEQFFTNGYDLSKLIDKLKKLDKEKQKLSDLEVDQKINRK